MVEFSVYICCGSFHKIFLLERFYKMNFVKGFTSRRIHTALYDNINLLWWFGLNVWVWKIVLSMVNKCSIFRYSRLLTGILFNRISIICFVTQCRKWKIWYSKNTVFSSLWKVGFSAHDVLRTSDILATQRKQ